MEVQKLYSEIKSIFNKTGPVIKDCEYIDRSLFYISRLYDDNILYDEQYNYIRPNRNQSQFKLVINYYQEIIYKLLSKRAITEKPTILQFHISTFYDSLEFFNLIEENFDIVSERFEEKIFELIKSLVESEDLENSENYEASIIIKLRRYNTCGDKDKVLEIAILNNLTKFSQLFIENEDVCMDISSCAKMLELLVVSKHFKNAILLIEKKEPWFIKDVFNNVENRSKKPLLYFAIKMNLITITTLIVKSGFDVSKKLVYKTPLHRLIIMLDDHCILKDDYIERLENLADLFLENDVNLNERVYEGIPLLHLLVESSRYKRRFHLINKFIQKGCDINIIYRCKTPLHNAVERHYEDYSNLEVINILIKNGAAINTHLGSSVYPFYEPKTPPLHDLFFDLIKNAKQNDTRILPVVDFFEKTFKLFLENGADVNIRCAEVNSLLHLISKYESHKTQKKLLGRWDESQVDYSVIIRTILMIIKHGGNVNLKNNKHETPLMLNPKNGMSCVLLLKNGAYYPKDCKPFEIVYQILNPLKLKKENCCVCTENVIKVRLDNCVHEFCEKCVYNFDNKCPLCRKTFNTFIHGKYDDDNEYYEDVYDDKENLCLRLKTITK